MTCPLRCSPDAAVRAHTTAARRCSMIGLDAGARYVCSLSSPGRCRRTRWARWPQWGLSQLRVRGKAPQGETRGALPRRRSQSVVKVAQGVLASNHLSGIQVHFKALHSQGGSHMMASAQHDPPFLRPALPYSTLTLESFAWQACQGSISLPEGTENSGGPPRESNPYYTDKAGGGAG